ncbi:hypothetical protein PHAVU_004G158400 [Phaseolus vulgaris]|uniref:Uncharacterized protein n=1 Tax=Phaseolus vulgaris TaxID=3885 RepID=V7C3N0_PHAVU|nr:hypothetical protein PHAVU_004G158400g [Phaseolus vulgaris]ESW24767.1 hypothetical protein PHAVU_004G158400g [Phaseolus vulgaris]
MEDSKKRVRDELATDSPHFKIPRVHSSESLLQPDVHLQDHIFNILDDADNVSDRATVQGLDSVIKSFEDEIKAPAFDPTQLPDSGELQNKLGYLLEASDDELGLPPTEAAAEEPGRVDPELDPEMAELAAFNGFEDYVPGFDAFGFGSEFAAECDDGAAGFVTVDGLFDYADSPADVLWRSESLQAM